MDISNLSKIILDYVEKEDFITDNQILLLAKQCYPKFNSSYKNIIISMLMDKKIIYSYDVNVYKGYRGRKKFAPYQNKTIENNLSKYLKNKQIKISYFNSSFYNSLSSLQSTKNYVFLGIESYAVNYIVDKIQKDNKKVIVTNDLIKLKNIFFGNNFNFDYVIKTINIDTPLFKKRSKFFYYPKLETLLVDLISNKVLFNLYSSEIENIYLSAFKEYAIKINTLLRYANKKGIKEKIISILSYINFNSKRGEFDCD